MKLRISAWVISALLAPVLHGQTRQPFQATATKRIVSVTTQCNATSGRKVQPDVTLALTAAIPDQSLDCGSSGHMKFTNFTADWPLTIRGTETTPSNPFPVI